MSPVPFFRQVERVGLLCVVDADPAAARDAPETAWLCAAAVGELTALLGEDGPPVVTLTPNDERLADPAVLTVLLHAHARADASAGIVTAFAAALHRGRPDAGAPPFFIAPPEAVVAPHGPAPPGPVREALNRLLKAAVARPLLANREPRRGVAP